MPGNTKAQVCLPRYLFADEHPDGIVAATAARSSVSGAVPGKACSATLGGDAIASREAGGLLCLEEDLGGGQHTLHMVC